jgi:hypothetical protein
MNWMIRMSLVLDPGLRRDDDIRGDRYFLNHHMDPGLRRDDDFLRDGHILDWCLL